MLYMVQMTVNLPDSMSAEKQAELIEAEKEYSQNAQREGKIAGLWRISGAWANYCLFDVAGNEELHELISGFPLFPYLEIDVTPLAKHPNSIR